MLNYVIDLPVCLLFISLLRFNPSCSTGVPESGPGAAETREPPGHPPAVPNLALHRAGGAAAQRSGPVRSAGGAEAGTQP